MDEVTATRLFWNQDFDVQLTLPLHENYIYATAAEKNTKYFYFIPTFQSIFEGVSRAL